MPNRQALLGLVLLLALGSPTLAASSQPKGLLNITPFLTCIEPDNPNDPQSPFTAYFGYESREQAIIQVLVGNDNRFVPNPANREQPQLFLPGYFEKAFRSTFPGGQVFQWLFLGNAVTISNNSPRCADNLRAPLHPALTLTSGATQQAPAGAAFAQPIVVRATANGLPVPGMILQAIAPAGGPSAALSPADGIIVTDDTGSATLTATANALAGSYRVRIVAGTGTAARSSAFVALTNTP